MFDTIINAYNEAVFDTDKERAFKIVNDALSQGISAENIVFHVIIPAIEAMLAEIGKDQDSNLAQHFMTAKIASEITEKMLEKFQQPPEFIGRVIIGTSAGDLHSLGKRIVSGCLKAMMVDVIDIGVNVKPERFVEAAIEKDAQIIAISSMMMHTAISEQGSLGVRALLHASKLEHRFKIVVGGAPFRFDSELYLSTGADAWAEDAITASKVIVELIHKVNAS